MSGRHPPAQVFLFTASPGHGYSAGRSTRCLESVGLRAEETGELTQQNFRRLLRGGGPLLLLRSGAWLVRTEDFKFPPSSATGKGLCALGAVRTPPETEPETALAAQLWREALCHTGGDFAAARGSPNRSGHDHPRASDSPQPRPQQECCGGDSRAPTRAAPRPSASPPELACVYLDSIAVAALHKQGASSLAEMLELAWDNFRVVHYAPLDVYDDPGLRVLQVITALQRGGAERMTLDLVAELPAQDVRTRLATLGRPAREAFETPPRTIELASAGGNAESRAAALARAAIAFGADVIHGHLLTGEGLRRLSAAGFPVVATVHNTRAGWPKGLTDLPPGHGVLLAACSQAVEAELRAAQVPVPLRTAWNGIDRREFSLTPEHLAEGRQWRRTWGFGEHDFVLISVANPRPQKRLHLLPAILAALRGRLGPGTEARLVFSGEPMRGNPEAEECMARTRAEIARLGLEAHARWTGPVANVPGLLAAADVLVSTSAHEGLCLAQLEALAMGRPVVATDVGGAREVAWDNPSVHLLPVDATPEQFARVLECLSRSPAPAVHRLDNWSRERMARRYRWLYPRAIAAARRGRRGQGLWLLTNNFSTGGAQSSARRLLAGLAAQGVPVRAAVVEEQPAHPTPGRQALLDAGIPVLAIPATAARDTATAAETLLAAIDDDPPQAVVFWNLRPAFKVLLADALLDVAVFDVSPGEMFFASLETYFAVPPTGLPYRTTRDYGARLAGVIVKYHAEAAQAAEVLGAPVHVIPNGVPRLDPAPALPAARPQLVIGTAARLNPQKRLEDLLEALHLAHDRLPGYRLQIAGGVERGCEDYAARLRTAANGLPVEWLGERPDISAFHRELDLFAMISEPAGCPNASLEAMAAGLPVVATAVGGAGEQVLDGHNGRLVAARAPKPLADALVELATQPALRQKMGTAARDLIRKRFSLERMIADYRRICLGEGAG